MNFLKSRSPARLISIAIALMAGFFLGLLLTAVLAISLWSSLS